MTPSPRLGSPPLRWLMSSITVAALANHVLTQVLAQTGVVSWLGARFAGSPAPSNC